MSVPWDQDYNSTAEAYQAAKRVLAGLLSSLDSLPDDHSDAPAIRVMIEEAVEQVRLLHSLLQTGMEESW